MADYLNAMDERMAKLPARTAKPRHTYRMRHQGEYKEYFGFMDCCNLATDVPRYPDEHLDYWADVYQREQLLQHGILFPHFLQFPLEVLDAVARYPLPLLPAQQAVRDRLDADDQVREQQAAVLDRVSAGGSR